MEANPDWEKSVTGKITNEDLKCLRTYCTRALVEFLLQLEADVMVAALYELYARGKYERLKELYKNEDIRDKFQFFVPIFDVDSKHYQILTEFFKRVRNAY